eukprot:365740-Chlamydomonas_euryale.AAC.4
MCGGGNILCQARRVCKHGWLAGQLQDTIRMEIDAAITRAPEYEGTANPQTWKCALGVAHSATNPRDTGAARLACF